MPADSLLQTAATEPNDSLRLGLMASAFRQLLFSAPEKALQVARDYQALAEKAKVRGAKAKGWNFLGMSHFTQNDYEAAVHFYARAQQQAELEGDSLYAAIVVNNIAACYESRGATDEAIRYFGEALLRFQRLGDKSWAAKVSHNLGKQQTAKKDHAASLKHYQLAFEMFTELGDSHFAGLARTGVGNFYLETGQFATALEHYAAAEKLVDPAQDPTAVAILLENEANALIKLGKTREAEPILQRALALAQQHAALDLETNIAKVCVMLHRARGDFKSAFEWQERFVALSDSLFDREKDAALVDALKKYELERKEKEIALKDLSLENARRQRFVLWAVIALLAGLSLAGLYLVRLKQRTNRELAEKNAAITKTLAEKELLMQEIFSLEKFNDGLISRLTTKEFEILQDIYEGRNNQQIADKHFISLNTVKTHVKHVFEKLGVSSRTELMALVRKRLGS